MGAETSKGSGRKKPLMLELFKGTGSVGKWLKKWDLMYLV